MKTYPCMFSGSKLIMLETEQLILRKVVDDDIDLYLKMYTCSETTKYLPGGRPYIYDQIKELLEKRIKHWENGFGMFTVVEKSTSHKIGYVGVELSPKPLFCDIRYGIETSRRGNGYAVIAGIECLRFTFGIGKHEKVYGASVRQNHSSIKVLRRFGMTPEPDIDIYGADDVIYFSLVKSDFDEKTITTLVDVWSLP